MMQFNNDIKLVDLCSQQDLNSAIFNFLERNKSTQDKLV